MKYPLGTANGDAGEFFTAYKVAKELGWPCRLFDIDIGIDAQVEILTASRESTGRFVALQVKATSVEEVDCRYVSAKQLDYWRSLNIPVFVVLVNLKNEEMFWHLIEETREYEVTAKGRRKIPFDLGSDKFSSLSARTIAEAAERLAMSHINGYLASVDEAIDKIQLSVEDVRRGSPDPYELIANMDSRVELSNLIAQASAASGIAKVGDAVVSDCEMRLSWALRDLQEVMKPMENDYGDRGEISEFLEEGYSSRPCAD
jgi:hypothetical protein